MVVFPPPCTPRILDAYPNVPISPSVRTSVIHDYGVGSFARFQNPTSVISIHDRPDFHSLSHLEIRQRLDAEGHKSEIVIIDSDTAANHAVWFVLSTADSAAYTDIEKDWKYPAKEYPGEFTLWKLHILTQDLPFQYDFLIGGGKAFWEDIEQPYDPHDPQIPPFSSGRDLSKKEQAMNNDWYARVIITALSGEYEFSDDPKAREQPQFGVPPPHVVRLTREAARDAGLLTEWEAWRDPLPSPGASIRFRVWYDWDSPKWAWDGTTPRNETASGRSRKNNGKLRMCRAPTWNPNGAVQRLPLMWNGRMLNQSVPATA